MELLRRLFIPYASQADLFTALDVTVKMFIAVVLSGIIGWEREQHDQPAGLRTHIILCVGSTLITIVSVHIVTDLGGVERTRVMAQIVSGIGFLGAGAIMRLGTTVRGLTTATTLWSIAGVGMAIGAGYYLPAVIAIVTMYVVLHHLDNLAVRATAGRIMHLSVIADAQPGRVGQIEAMLTREGVQVRSLRAHAHTKKGTIEIEGMIKMPGKKQDPAPIIQQLLEIEGVKEGYLN